MPYTTDQSEIIKGIIKSYCANVEGPDDIATENDYLPVHPLDLKTTDSAAHIDEVPSGPSSVPVSPPLPTSSSLPGIQQPEQSTPSMSNKPFVYKPGADLTKSLFGEKSVHLPAMQDEEVLGIGQLSEGQSIIQQPEENGKSLPHNQGVTLQSKKNTVPTMSVPTWAQPHSSQPALQNEEMLDAVIPLNAQSDAQQSEESGEALPENREVAPQIKRRSVPTVSIPSWAQQSTRHTDQEQIAPDNNGPDDTRAQSVGDDSGKERRSISPPKRVSSSSLSVIFGGPSTDHCAGSSSDQQSSDIDHENVETPVRTTMPSKGGVP